MRAFGNLTNRMLEGKTEIVPEVGMGATELCYSDRRAYTIIKIKSKCRIIVQRDHVQRIDNNGMSDCQDYEYTRNEDGYTYELTKTKYGWKTLGGGNYWGLGYRDEYYDYSF